MNKVALGTQKRKSYVLLGAFFKLWGKVGCLRVAGCALEELLEAPGGSRRVPWGPLGPSGVPWASLGRPLVCPWRPLGLPWELLEALRGASWLLFESKCVEKVKSPTSKIIEISLVFVVFSRSGGRTGDHGGFR